jgi:hypothetical protein
MDAASLELYERNRLDPGVTFFSIDVIERNVKAMCEARAQRLGSSVFVPAGAKVGWDVRAIATMASDARAVAAYRNRGGDEDEDEDEDAALEEPDREVVERERAARCVEIK